ncbi:MAG: glycosyltransferase family 1 protein [Acidobacteriota bacterium]
MRKIILDARKVGDYGIGEYIKALFPAIINSDEYDHRVLINDNDEQADKLIEELPESDIIRVHSRNYTLREHKEIPKAVRNLSDFLYFSPHYIFPYFLKNRLIVTIHDLIHFKFPQYFKPEIKVKIAGRFIRKIKNSDSKVFTVSKNSKKDLIEIFGFSENSIKVIHNGIPEIFFKYKKGANPKPFPYIMYTGNFKPHKNIDVLLNAFGMLSEKHPSLRLVLTGVENNKQLTEMTDKYKIGEKVFPTGFISTEELINLLDFSEFFVFPSLYEGFGFPPLEAMARGKSVISSDCGSLGEVLGDAAINFNPLSPEDLFIKMDKLLTDQALRSEYEEKGFKHASFFTVNKMTETYLDLLRNI